MEKRNFLVFLFMLLLSLTFLLILPFPIVEIDMVDRVVEVFDGDTFETLEVKSVRLADIDAPEIDEVGYEEAKVFLKSLVGNKLVYIDIDDYGSTTWGRTVCLVYVRYNSTHLLNVNKELVDSGHAVVWDHENNEFDPYAWTEFVNYPSDTENIFQLITNERFKLLLKALIISVITVIVVSVFKVRRKS